MAPKIRSSQSVEGRAGLEVGSVAGHLLGTLEALSLILSTDKRKTVEGVGGMGGGPVDRVLA